MIEYIRHVPSWLRTWLAVAIIAGPFVAWALAFRREVRILISFAIFEALRDWPLFAAIVVILIALRLRAPDRGGLPSIAGLRLVAIGRMPKRTKRVLVAGALTMLLFLIVAVLPSRYRYFAEYHFPSRALAHLRKGEYLQAKQICDRYFVLYPRKGKTGESKDYTCTAVRDLTSSMILLYRYSLETMPETRSVNNLPLAPATEMREQALRVSKAWGGAGDVAAKPISDQPK